MSEHPILPTPAAKWNRRYQTAPMPGGPCAVLQQHSHRLPAQGCALDLAAGLGGNALFLASRGLQCQAWDIAEVGLQRLAQRAEQLNLAIETRCRDVETQPPLAQSFDVICVSFFLHRPSLDQLAAALRPQGLLFYQTFVRLPGSSGGPSNADFVLLPGELPDQFASLHIEHYWEGFLSDPDTTTRADGPTGPALAMLVARKP